MDVGPGVMLGGKYRLERELGRGGMGEVWSAVDQTSQGRVALKLLLEEGGAFDVEGYRRFEREAATVQRLQHPNIVTCSAFMAPAGEPAFMVMELLEGESLRERLARRGPLATGEAVGILRQVLGALDEVHAAGIVHRDLKPANVFLRADGVVKVLDFGVLKLIDESGSSYSRTGMLVGTPGYMTPEQIRAHPVTARTDVFAAGVCLFEMLTGELPFLGRGATLLANTRDGAPRRADAVAPHVPPVLADVIGRALARDPAARFAGAREMLAALEGLDGLAAPGTQRLPTAPTQRLPHSAPTELEGTALEVTALEHTVPVEPRAAVPSTQVSPPWDPDPTRRQ